MSFQLQPALGDLQNVGDISTLNATLELELNGVSGAKADISGTWVGTIVFEQFIQYAWYPVGCFDGTTGTSLSTTGTSVNTIIVLVGIAGVSKLRARFSSYTSGTASVFFRASNGVSNVFVDNLISKNLKTEPNANENSTYSPDPSNYKITSIPLNLDASGRLETHTTSTTDEGSFSDDFNGSSITTALSGTLNFNNSSTNITGLGTTFTTQVKVGQYIKKISDSESSYVQVLNIISDTSLTLFTAYSGTTSSTTGIISNYLTSTAIGTSLTIGSSNLTLTGFTTGGLNTYVSRSGDYGPMKFISQNTTINQRVVNQILTIGFRDTAISPNIRAEFSFNGTVTNRVDCITSTSSLAADTFTTTVILPPNSSGSSLTSAAQQYEIEVSDDSIIFVINGVKVATSSIHIPGAYDNLNIFAGINNTGTVVGNTIFTIDRIQFKNIDQLEIAGSFGGDPLRIRFPKNRFLNITGNVTTQVVSGPGFLYRIILGNNSTGGTVTIYDNTAGSGTVIATISLGTVGSTGPNVINFEVDFNIGLTIITAGSTTNNITAIYDSAS